MPHKTPITIDSINFDNEEEMDALEAQVLKQGLKNIQSDIREAVKRHIIDKKGRLLKTELPPDMREDAGTDFGG